MKRNFLRVTVLVAMQVFVTGGTQAWSPSYRQQQSSPIVAQLGIKLRGKYQPQTDSVLCEVFFDNHSQILPRHGRASLIVTAHHGMTTLLRSDHTLGSFTAFTDPAFGKGSTPRPVGFGFRFYINPKLLKDASIILDMNNSVSPFRIKSGEYEFPVKDFLPDYEELAAALPAAPAPPPATSPPTAGK